MLSTFLEGQALHQPENYLILFILLHCYYPVIVRNIDSFNRKAQNGLSKSGTWKFDTKILPAGPRQSLDRTHDLSMLQHRKGLAYFSNLVPIIISYNKTWATGQTIHDLTPLVHDHAVAIGFPSVDMVSTLPGCNNIAKVFYGTGSPVTAVNAEGMAMISTPRSAMLRNISGNRRS